MSHIYYWIENIFLILGMFVYFLLLTPFIYVRLLVHIMQKISGWKNKLCYSLGWVFFGIFYMIYNCLIDACIFINILCLSHSENHDVNEEENQKRDLHKLVIYKDLHKTLHELYDLSIHCHNILSKKQMIQKMK